MKRLDSINYQFVEFIPAALEEGTVYVSIPHTTAVHKCCCGCGSKVVTPITPTDWKLIFNGKSISLDPSIGNWSFPCRSHYWIQKNKIRWAGQWSQEQVDRGRRHENEAAQEYYTRTAAAEPAEEPAKTDSEKPKFNFWRMVGKWVRLGGRKP